MILINLLPHREAARQRRKQNFQMTLLASLLAGLLLAALIYSWLQIQIGVQQERNAFLTQEIGHLQQQIKEIEGLEGDIKALRERQRAVEALQANRNLPVHLLNEVVRLLPEGVFLTSLRQNELLIDINGVAQSNERVSEMLHNFSGASPWFAQAKLKEIVAGTVTLAPHDERKVVNFSLSVALVLPSHEAIQAHVQQTSILRRGQQ